MSETNDLPKGWCWTNLGEVTAESLNGYGKRRQDVGEPAIVLRLADVLNGNVSLASTRRVNSTDEQVSKYALCEDDLLAIRVNGSPDLVGRLIRAGEYDEPVLFCDHFIRLRLSDVNLAKYIRFYADTAPVRNYIDKNKVSSAGQNTVSQSTLANVEVPLPPLNEQHRIVSKIEELFSDLDAGVAALERAKANLKRYRAAVLKAAVEGKLTEQWRADNPADEPADKLLERILAERRTKWEEQQLLCFEAKGKKPPKGWREKYKEPAAPDAANLPALPEGWCWATVEQCNPADRTCAYGVLQPGPDVDGGIPFVRVCDIADGKVAIDQLKRIAPEISEKYKRTLLKGGEVLLTIVGTIGRTAVAPDTLRGANTARAVAVIPVNEPILPRFIEIMLRDPRMRNRLTKAAHEVARKTLNLEDVRAACLPLAPLDEQREIIGLVESQISVIDEVEAEIERSEKRSSRLWQSILKRAFEGNLVPQDPDDEPASELLNRIFAEREIGKATNDTNGKAKARRKRATKNKQP